MDLLDQLYAEARQAAGSRVKAKPPARHTSLPDPLAIESRELFTNPDNWQAAGYVALIHADTESLLGNFQELRHKTVPDARRLVRVDTPVPVSRSERVEGQWWINPETTEVCGYETWHAQQELVVDLNLDRLGVFAPLCEVIVHLAYGNIARIVLAVETQFASTAGNELPWLPAGTNVLPVMGQESKMTVKKELRI